MTSIKVSRMRGRGEVPSTLDTNTLQELSSVLGRIFSVRLEVPEALKGAPYEKNVKEFCVGLLENPGDHAWWPDLRSLGANERMSVSASLFLARKALPSSPDPRQAEKHARLMSAPAQETPEAFFRHIDSRIDAMFKPGWDRSYQSRVFSHTPTSSACLQYSRAKGGARRWLSEQGRDWFHDTCLGGTQFPTDFKVRYSVVETGGKQRGVTVADGYSHVLGPLHRTLYDHLSQFDWLLRGDARGKKFSSFQQKKGEVFVSGDYESATDNLSLEVTEYILARILRNARSVPPALREYALRSLRAEISYPGGRVVRQRRGQLMGNYLSFPLLCLQNYLAFTFAIPRPVPLRINGDDIVFRCLPSEYLVWKEKVGAAGLTLCKGKTFVDDRFFSLNSSFFKGGSRRVWEIPVVRLKSAVVIGENPFSGSAFTKFIRGWHGESRRLLGGMWLRHRRAAIQTTGRSVEALGIPADNSQLHTAGLSVREAFYRGYRNHLRLPEQPMPQVPLKGQEPLPYVRVPTRGLHVNGTRLCRWQREYRDSCADSVWKPNPSQGALWDEWWASVRVHSREVQWLAWKRTTKLVHKMGTRMNLVLRPPAVRDRVKRSWIPVEEYSILNDGLSRRGIGAY